MEELYVLRVMLSTLPRLIILGLIVYFVYRYIMKKKGLSKKDAAKEAGRIEKNLLSQGLLVLSVLLIAPIVGMIHTQIGSPFDELAVALIALGLIILAAGLISYRYNISSTVPIMIVSAYVWWFIFMTKIFEITNLSPTSTAAIGTILISLGLYQLYHWHRKAKKPVCYFANWYWLLSFVPFITFLFILSSNSGISLLEEMTKGALIYQHLPSLTAVIILFVGLLLITTINMLKRHVDLSLSISTTFLAVFFVLLGFMQNLDLFTRGALNTTGMMFAGIFNLILFFFILGFIFLGYRLGTAWRVNFGAVLMFLFIFIKYMDWFFGFLDKSLFFVGAGLLLFGVGFIMERGRKQLIAKMK